MVAYLQYVKTHYHKLHALCPNRYISGFFSMYVILFSWCGNEIIIIIIHSIWLPWHYIHVLVCPRREVKRFIDLTTDETSDLWIAAKKVGGQLEHYHKASSLTFSIQVRVCQLFVVGFKLLVLFISPCCINCKIYLTFATKYGLHVLYHAMQSFIFIIFLNRPIWPWYFIIFYRHYFKFMFIYSPLRYNCSTNDIMAHTI